MSLSKAKAKRPVGALLLGYTPLFTITILVVPVFAGFLGALRSAYLDGAMGMERALSWQALPEAIWLSVKTGVVSTALSLFIVLLLIAAFYETRFFRLIKRSMTPLLSVPHAAAALGIVFLLSPSGWIFRLFSPWASGFQRPPDILLVNDPGGWALIFGLVIKEVPFLLLMSLAAMPQINVRKGMRVTAAIGAGRIAGFIIAVLPSLYHQIRIPTYAVLAYAMSAVEMALILGPSLPHSLSAQVVMWMSDPTLTHQSTASAAALIQFFIVVVVLFAWRLMEILVKTLLIRVTHNGLRLVWADRLATMVGCVLMVLVSGALAMGLCGLVLWSFAGLWRFPSALPETLTLNIWIRAWESLLGTTIETLRIAFFAAFSSLVMTLACLEAEHRYGLSVTVRSMWILYLPLLMPQVSFLPGLQVFTLFAGIDGDWYAVVACHIVFVFPYVFLSLAPAFRAWDGRIALAGAALAASPGRVFWVLRLPMLARSILIAFAIGLAVSIGQYLPTLLIGAGRVETLTTEAVSLSSGGNRRLIGAYALLQMLLPALGFALAIALPTIWFRDRRDMGEHTS